jgi:adenine-specific DNA-methyltransferase
MSDLPERFDLVSQDPSADRVATLRSLFPDAFREDKIDVDAFRRSLGDWAESGPERFGLTWPGKADCMRVIQEPSIGTLVPMREESVDFDATQNVIIEGENLEVLKLLQKAYYGKVKLIYIDPPYNTGKEFIYPDNFKEGLTDYLRYSGQVDDDGFKLTANAETDGRYHSKWLSMMYPRLFLARNLLREDGVIFVSIDDHEVHNLRALMNEIFGEENFAAEIAVVNNLKGRNDRDNIATSHEYLLMYTREEFESLGLPLTAEQRAEYRHLSAEGKAFQWRDLRKRGGADTRALRPNLFFPVYVDPSDGSVSMTRSAQYSAEVLPRKSDGTDGCWRWGVPTVTKNVAELRGSKVEGRERWNVSYRVFLENDDGMRVAKPKSVWTGPELSTDAATKALRALLPEIADLTPKPVGLIRRIVVQSMDSGDMCVDLFAGSGTTGQAVFEQNQADGLSRHFVLAQLPEPVETAGYQSLAEITRARVKRAAEAVASEPVTLGAEEPDLGFRAYRLERSNFQVWNSENCDPQQVVEQLGLLVDHILDKPASESVLAELLLKAGYPLTSPTESLSLAGIKVYSVSEGALLVCLGEAFTIELFEAMVDLDPAMILVLDSGFGGSDELKVNALQTVRARNQRTGSDIVLRVV